MLFVNITEEWCLFCWLSEMMEEQLFLHMFKSAQTTIVDLNLLNAELNPSCKSQLAEFFWVGI